MVNCLANSEQIYFFFPHNKKKKKMSTIFPKQSKIFQNNQKFSKLNLKHIFTHFLNNGIPNML